MSVFVQGATYIRFARILFFFFISEILFYTLTHAYEIALVAIRVVSSCFFVTTTIEQSSKQRRNKKKQVKGLAPKNILFF